MELANAAYGLQEMSLELDVYQEASSFKEVLIKYQQSVEAAKVTFYRLSVYHFFRFFICLFCYAIYFIIFLILSFFFSFHFYYYFVHFKVLFFIVEIIFMKSSVLEFLIKM